MAKKIIITIFFLYFAPSDSRKKFTEVIYPPKICLPVILLISATGGGAFLEEAFLFETMTTPIGI